MEQKNAATAEIEEQEWDRIVDTDLRGVFLCMKYEIPLLLKQGGGAIVNTSSGADIIGIKGKAAYTAAKHGVIGLTKSAALDYTSQNIRVNAVAPGYTDTPMMVRFTGGTAEGREQVIAEAGRTDGTARRNCQCRCLAVFGRGCLRRRTHLGRQWRSNGAVKFVANYDAVAVSGDPARQCCVHGRLRGDYAVRLKNSVRRHDEYDDEK